MSCQVIFLPPNACSFAKPQVIYCLHLQLYRDSKDRYKQGQTKASLSLQHFLGVHSGFTLDKESNTIAIICQYVTLVLAFDTRERLIQWQVKIANNLGDDEQFLVQIQSAPSRGRIATGPARLHILERQFSMTVGVPPRLVGCWQIAQLRRYGVVEGRFCFEGGSRCGRGEGLYVLVTDQGHDMARAFQLAADGRLHSRRRHLSRNGETPRKRVDSDGSVTELTCGHEENVAWPSCETRPDCDYADTASLSEYPDTNYQDGGSWLAQNTMERCMSCISKLGALSRSSTMAQTPGTPAWTSDLNNSCTFSKDSAAATSNCALDDLCHDNLKLQSTASANGMDKCHGCVSRPFQPLSLDISTVSNQKKVMKPPMPLPLSAPCHNKNPYRNYDVPKPISINRMLGCGETCFSPTYGLYDTPKQLRERSGEYSNYDTPHPVTPCDCSQQANCSDKASMVLRRAACPCQRIMSWMSLPYCYRGHGRENTAPIIQRVRLSGEGKMPIASSTKTIPIYATIDRSKKTKCRLTPAVTQSTNIQINPDYSKEKIQRFFMMENKLIGSSFRGSERGNTQKNHIITECGNNNRESSLYKNFEFVKSLKYYENSKDVLFRANIIQNEIPVENSNLRVHPVHRNGMKVCTKCSHTCYQGSSKSNEKQDDYLMMEPSPKNNNLDDLTRKPDLSNKHFSGYLPMHPISNVLSGTFKNNIIEYSFLTDTGQLSKRAASSPSLSAPVVNRRTKNSEIHLRSSESVMFQLDSPSISAICSPYLRRRPLFNNFSEDSEPRLSRVSASLRKRSISADSARYIEDLDSIAEGTTSSSPTQIINQDSSKNTSDYSLCSQSLSNKRLNDLRLSNLGNLSNLNSCTGGNPSVKTSSHEVLYDKLVLSRPEVVTGSRLSTKDSIERPGLVAHIRRSSSVPCRSGYNRDSSSSNDSGVSVGSLKQRGYDFFEFELPLTTSMSTIRHHQALNQYQSKTHTDCFHASLPRRSKSSVPLPNLSFKFKDLQLPHKSSSADAEVPICLIKKEPKGCVSPNKLPYIDSRSTSSDTSDMSDYIETLSLSSYSSSDTPESLRLGRTAATTLRPRFGKEYHKIDRYILEGDFKIPSFSTTSQNSGNPEPTGFITTAQDL